MEEDVMPGHSAIPHSSSRFEDSNVDPDKRESDIGTEIKYLSDEDRSIRLYETLVQTGVSEKMRLVCRERVIHDIKMSICNMLLWTPSFCSHFGSSIEGTAIRAMAPDIDRATILCGRVFNDASKGKHKPVSYLIVQDERTLPGYVKLQMVSRGIPLDTTYSNDGPFVEPDTFGRLCRNEIGMLGPVRFPYYDNYFVKVNGPALRILMDDECVDSVIGFECCDFLNNISHWVRRKRLYEWPSKHLLDRCSRFPTFLVNIGHPFSKETEIEWRISFSFFERELMFSLNPTQHKCYVALKMIKKDILNQEILNQTLPKDNQALPEEVITSYHLKTCLFWAVENTPEEMWRPDQIMRCICVCLWFLLYFVLIKNCPNYFLPAANLFEREAFLSFEKRVFEVIKDSMTQLIDIICRIKCADVGAIFVGIFSRNIENGSCVIDEMTQLRTKTLAVLHLEILLMANVEKECESIETRITSWNNMLLQLDIMQIPSNFFGFDDLAIEDVKRIINLQINLRLTLCNAVKAITSPDESEQLRHIALTMDRDLYPAKLVHLTLLYKLNRLSECEKIIKTELDNIAEEISEFCQCQRSLGYNEKIDLTAPDINTSFRKQITCMVFMPAEKGLVLEPLDFELNKPAFDGDNQEQRDYCQPFNHNWASVDGRLYRVFMKYLVYSGLNNNLMADVYFWTIRLLVREGKMYHQSVAFNLLGWICARQGLLAEALDWWRTSLKRHPRRNAVNRYCVDFFSKCIGQKFSE